MANDNKGLTPMMRQFFEMKSKHPEALLLFRCGDFYETYCEDAVEASRILGITLTRRNNGGATGSIEMAGFPHHALDTYLPKLIRAGKRVAVCDQLEDPKKKRLEIKGKKGLSQMVRHGSHKRRWRLRWYVRTVALRGSFHGVPLLTSVEHVSGGHIYT